MNLKSIIIGSVIIIGLYLLITFQAVKWANNVSAQTEKNFADAVRVMQGEKVDR